MTSEHDMPEKQRRFWRSRYAVGFLILGAVGAYFLLTEHLAHVVGALPFLLLLSCPLMHLFMHHGHGGHGHSSASRSAGDVPEPKKPGGSGGAK